MISRRTPKIGRWLLFLLLFFSSFAQAQTHSGSGTLWLVDGTDREAREREAQLREVLASSRSQEHVVGLEGIQQHIERYGLEVPECLAGTGNCHSDFALAVQALAVNLLVRIELQRGGVVDVTAYDSNGKLIRTLRVEARNARQAIMRAVSEITGATGQLLIESTPPGATVYVEGSEVGKTPLSRPMTVGSYNVDILLPGYGAVHDTIDIPPDGTARRNFNLERLQATLTVRSGTPDAYILIDVDPTRLPTNEALLIDPGPHRITVEAEGYDPVTERFDFEPGQERELSATLALSMRELTRRKVDAVYRRPIMLQAGLRYMRYGTDWAGARHSSSSDRIDCSVRPTTGACQSTPVNSVGFDISAIYAWRYLEIEGLGISFYHLGQNSAANDFQLENNPSLQPSHVSGSRTLFRVGHVGGRYLINEYIEPYARLGFSFAADRLRTEDLVGGTGERERFKRAAVLFEVRAGARIRMNQLLYGYADAGVAFDVKNKGTKAGFELGAGIGINLPNPFTRARAHEGDALQRSANQDALPEEL